MERTLVLLKPGIIQRQLMGEIINRFEKRGLRIVGMKMMQLNDEILDEHYSHLTEKPFFKSLKESMTITPVVALAIEGVDAIRVVRMMAGTTNGRNAAPGTIRGDYCVSNQQNVVHASDGPHTAYDELKRFFKDGEIFDFGNTNLDRLYAPDEYNRNE
ncbi:MAG: nucleoside-diphosphate kinase [Bacteroidales bacterium]|nr:nucleoside-diphosphate kinase [Candidatus Physcousia equi]